MSTKYLTSKSSQRKAANRGRRQDAPAGLGDVFVVFDRSSNCKLVSENVRKDANNVPLLDSDGNQIVERSVAYRVIVAKHGPVVHNVDDKLVDAAENAYRGCSARLRIRSYDSMLEEDLESGVIPGAHDMSVESHLDDLLASGQNPGWVYSNATYVKATKVGEKQWKEESIAYNAGTVHLSPNC